jgi:hypothetical protein
MATGDPPIDPNLPDPAKLQEVTEASIDAAESLANLSSHANDTQDAFDFLDKTLGRVKTTFDRFDSTLGDFGVSLNVSKTLTEDQITQFSLLSAAVLGTRESYTSLASVDTSGLNTFTNQIKYISDELAHSKSGISALVNVAQSAFGTAIPKEIQGSLGAVQQFVLNLAQSADNALRLQNAYLQLSAKTGNLGNVFALAGDKLENINSLLQKHAQMMADAGAATGAPTEAIEKYYSELGAVPGALDSLVVSSADANEKTNMLTATMKVAAGTGRSFEDVVDDMKVAFRDYGLTGEQALKFTAQISSVSQDLGVELETVRGALRSGADAFKLFADSGASASNMATGLAEVMDRYSMALKSTGLNGTQALDVIKGMTGQISNMGIAQKSFLSAQTGGSGGLMGAFQIDKMMRDGDMKGVFEKVRQQMMKQFGTIVTVDEASKSQAGAAQMTRQMQILRQGPLGQFAKSDVEAERILEGFKAAQAGGGGGLNPDIVKETMDKGTSVQEKSYTVMSDMRSHLEAIHKAADIGTLNFVQKSGLTAGAGINVAGMTQNGAADRMSSGLRARMLSATNMSTDEVSNSAAAAMKQKLLLDTTGAAAVKAITEFRDSFKLVPDVIKGPTEALKKAIGMGDVNGAKSQIKLLEDSIKARKSTDASEVKAQTDMINNAKAFIAANDNAPAINLAQAAGNRKAAPASTRVGIAADRATSKASLAAGTTTGGGGTMDHAHLASSKSDVTVHVTGFCLKCKQEIDSASQKNALSPQGKI